MHDEMKWIESTLDGIIACIVHSQVGGINFGFIVAFLVLVYFQSDFPDWVSLFYFKKVSINLMYLNFSLASKYFQFGIEHIRRWRGRGRRRRVETNIVLFDLRFLFTFERFPSLSLGFEQSIRFLIINTIHTLMVMMIILLVVVSYYLAIVQLSCSDSTTGELNLYPLYN